MTNILSLEQALNDSKEAATQKFSEEVLRIQGETKLFVPMDDAESLYMAVDSEISYVSAHYEFIQQGLKHIDIHKGNGAHAFHMNPFSLYRMRQIYEELELTIPSWVPVVWRLEKPYKEHNVTYVLNWSTVRASQVSNTLVSFLTMRLSGDIKPAQPGSLSQNKALQTLKASGNLPKQIDKPVEVTEPEVKKDVTGTSSAPAQAPSTEQARPTLSLASTTEPLEQKKVTVPVEQVTCSNDELSDEVSHGSFVAKKYLMLMQSATNRGLEFNLSIEELSQMLRKKECYFTGEPLVSFVHCRDQVNSGEVELPANYLTVDRLDSDKGYVSGNVVICSNEINQLKDRMPSQEFSKAIAMRKLMKEANMTPEMMRIIAG